MRILFFSEQFWPETNAPAIHVHERARIWVRLGHSVTVMTSAPNFPEGRLFGGYRNAWRQVGWVDGIKVVRVKTFISPNRGMIRRVLDYSSYFLSALAQSFREEPADVVVSTSPQLFVPVAGLLHAWWRDLPHVFELRDLWPASIIAVGAAQPGVVIRLLERLELRLYRQSNRVLSFTESFRQDLIRRGIAGDCIELTPNGTDLDLFHPRPKDPELECALGLKGRFVVGYIGTLGMAHGLGSVLEAAKQSEGLPITFVLAGPGAAKEELEQQAGAMGLTNVVFLSRQPREAMPALWSLCDLALVALKDTEVFRTVIPSKMYEAMAMGLPICFSGPEGEASQFVLGHHAGMAIPPEDSTALASAVSRFFLDPVLREGARQGAECARAGFSREAQAAQTLAILEQVVLKWAGADRRGGDS